MEKYGIVVDSTTYLTDEQFKKYNIKRASLNVIVEGDTYKELEITNDFVFDQMKHHRLTTSQPSPGEFYDLYLEMLKQYERVFVVPISQNLSGTYQSAILAHSMLDDKDMEKVHIFNTMNAAYGNELLVLELVDMMKQEIEETAIIERMNRLIDHSKLIFTIESLTNLMRSGRLSRAKALIGTVMRVKPLIQLDDGKLDLFTSTRTHKKALSEIISMMKETTKGFKRIMVRIQNQHSDTQTEVLIETVKEHFKDAEISINSYIGPVFSIHIGMQGYGIAWTGE
ncbi:MAG: DegV family protein [Candidatus Izemoplasmataceae bacterium]